MKKLALIVTLFSCGYLYSQENSNSTAKGNGAEEAKWNFQDARKVVKSRPFDLFNAVPTLAADFELGGFKEGLFAFQGGLGYIPDYLQPFSGRATEDLFNRMGGYMCRFEPRIYPFESKNHYFATEFYFRHLRISDEMSVGMEGTENPDEPWAQEFAYFVKADMIFHRFSTRFTMKYGWNWQLNSGVVFDFYGGLSFRLNQVASSSEIPEGGVVQPRWNIVDWNLEDGHRMAYPMPVFGVAIGYAIKK